jgi:predicted choloylglycine hydrolase
MDIKIFKGNFLEIGKQQGKIYRKNGMRLKNAEMNSKLFKNQLRIYKRYYPELLEEFKGISESGKFDEERLIYEFITKQGFRFIKKFDLQKACTIFGVRSKKGVFVGRNYDWCPVTEKIFEVYKVLNPERNSFLAFTDMGISDAADVKLKCLFYDPDDAINDKGLFIGLTFAYNDKWSYGLSSTHMIKLIAETCTTVEDALNMFKKVPLCCPKNFFVADKNGGMAVIEHTSKRFKVLYPENDVLIQTNHYVDSELSKEDTVLIHKPTHNTFLRYYEALQNINSRKEKFQLFDVIKILGGRKSCVCQSYPDMRTIWSLALDMKNRKYKLYWNVLGKRKEVFLKI